MYNKICGNCRLCYYCDKTNSKGLIFDIKDYYSLSYPREFCDNSENKEFNYSEEEDEYEFKNEFWTSKTTKNKVFFICERCHFDIDDGLHEQEYNEWEKECRTETDYHFFNGWHNAWLEDRNERIMNLLSKN